MKETGSSFSRWEGEHLIPQVMRIGTSFTNDGDASLLLKVQVWSPPPQRGGDGRHHLVTGECSTPSQSEVVMTSSSRCRKWPSPSKCGEMAVSSTILMEMSHPSRTEAAGHVLLKVKGWLAPPQVKKALNFLGVTLYSQGFLRILEKP